MEKTKSKSRIMKLIAVGVLLIVLTFALEMLNMRRSNRINMNNAMAISRSFYTQATEYAKANNGKFWENGTTNFGEFFAHVGCKSGYNFYYFSNDENMDGKHEATSYVYLAVPVSYNNGEEMYAFDELNALYLAELEKTDFTSPPDGNTKINWKGCIEPGEDGDITWTRIPGFKWNVRSTRR